MENVGFIETVLEMRNGKVAAEASSVQEFNHAEQAAANVAD